MKRLIVCLMAMMGVLTLSAQSIYDFTVKDDAGKDVSLAAQSLGLGTCCLGGPVRFLVSNEKCKFFLNRLDIPADYKLNYILAIGYPDEEPAAKPRDASKVKYIK